MHNACACDPHENQRWSNRSKGGKVSLLYQGKTSPLLAYIEIIRHRSFVLLIRDQHFVFFFRVCHTVFCRNGFRLRQLAQVRKRCLYNFKYGYFSYKNASIQYRRPLFTTRSRVRHVLLQMHTLYLTTFEQMNKNIHLLPF